MDDNLADYRQFCANRLKRLERCKKTKSFCNLEDEVSSPVINCASEFLLIGSENSSPCCNDTTYIGYSTAATSYFCSGSNICPSRTSFLKSGTLAPDESIKGSLLCNSHRVKSSQQAKHSVATTISNDKQADKTTDDDCRLSIPSYSSPHSSLANLSSVQPPYSEASSTQNLTAEVLRSTAAITNVNIVDDNDDCSRRTQRKFDLLREKMTGCQRLGSNYWKLAMEDIEGVEISLMENDVRLLQQLLALGDSIQELKSRNQPNRNSHMSMNSLEEEDDDKDDEELWPQNKATTLDNTLSTVTNLYLDDEPKENQNKQYFSRKNSVLRIPIPPRSSNRMSTNKKLQYRLSRLSQHYEQLKQNSTDNSTVSKDDIAPVMAVMTETLPNQPVSSILTKFTTTATAVARKETFGTTNTRISNGSIDSGIRDESCSNCSAGSLSPTLKNEKF